MLVDEDGTNNSVIARNDFYTPIVIKSPRVNIIGEFVHVNIVEVAPYHLIGEIVE